MMMMMMMMMASTARQVKHKHGEFKIRVYKSKQTRAAAGLTRPRQFVSSQAANTL